MQTFVDYGEGADDRPRFIMMEMMYTGAAATVECRDTSICKRDGGRYQHRTGYCRTRHRRDKGR